jgi:hypothetical protein
MRVAQGGMRVEAAAGGSACDLRRVPKRGTPGVDTETGTLVWKDKNESIHGEARL